MRNNFFNAVGLKKIQTKLFKRPGKPSKSLWKKVGKVALWSLAGFFVLIIFMFAWFAKDLPTPGKIRTLVSASSTRLFDRNMNPLYTISGEKKRIMIDHDQIPDIVKEATIALEDKDFYRHRGLDMSGLGRAVVFGGSRGGGSTITQQFIKNALLTSERTLIRKVKEAILAIQLEFLFSKDDILGMYLNEIPYGGNNYGVEAAAQSFFGKSVKDLTIGEAATLAALPQAPSTLSPYGPNTERLINRRNLALRLMAEQGYITKEEAEEAQATELATVPRRESITAPHFVLYVKSWLVDYFTDKLGDAQLAERRVEEGGMTVVTTLDLAHQRLAEDAVANAARTTLPNARASNAGIVSIDPRVGDILSMVGSVDYFQPQFGAFNIATANRQPGSAFKPIIYAAAFKEKYNPATTLFDLRTDFGGGYVPQNFDNRFRGPVTIRQALGNSLNIPAVKAMALVGQEKTVRTARDMGITTLNDPDRFGLSLALGGAEVRLLDMATAYGVLANNGTLMPTSPVLTITDNDGRKVFDRTEPKDGRLVLDPQVAYQVTHILADVDSKRPTFNASLPWLTLTGRPSATKTGTTNNFRDAWTVGYTPQIVAAVWAGNNDSTTMNRSGGSVAAAPIWDYYMERAHQDLPVENFAQPNGIEELAVDRLSNKLPVEGSDVITDIFARWQIPTERDDVNRRVRVCRENGLLAGSSIPDELAEERVFTFVTSERPSNPNWENPVRAWAAENRYNNRPPTEQCDISSAPQIQITSPSGTVTSNFAIRANASAASGVQQVAFFINNSQVGVVTSAPYQMDYSISSLSNGSHKLTAVVTSNSGATNSQEITFVVQKDNTPPGDVTNLNATSLGFGSVQLSWLDPSDSDLDKIRIYVRQNGVLVNTIEVAKGVQFRNISGLSGSGWCFSVRAVDTSGNESAGGTGTTVCANPS